MFCVMGLMNNTGYYLLYFTVATAAPSTVLYCLQYCTVYTVFNTVPGIYGTEGFVETES